MVTITFNGECQSIATIERFSVALDRFYKTEQFELWVLFEGGPSVCMLRNGENAWLMYLRFEGDSGYTSHKKNSKPGSASYVLSNGQVDEYPHSWCIDVEQCFKALAYFFVNKGAKPDWISWHES